MKQDQSDDNPPRAYSIDINPNLSMLIHGRPSYRIKREIQSKQTNQLSLMLRGANRAPPRGAPYPHISFLLTASLCRDTLSPIAWLRCPVFFLSWERRSQAFLSFLSLSLMNLHELDQVR